MPSPLILLDQNKNRLSRQGVAIEEVQTALVPRWIEHQAARASERGRPHSEAALRRLLDAVLPPAEPPAEWGAGDLLELRRAMHPGHPTTFRAGEPQPLFPHHRPPPAQGIWKMLERFFEWVAAPSFAQLHPIVQMSLVQARLLEIQPLADENEPVATAFATHFPVASGYLLPIPDPESARDFPIALEEAFQLSTDRLVHYNVGAALRAYRLADRL